jgi:hypothetical protein
MCYSSRPANGVGDQNWCNVAFGGSAASVKRFDGNTPYFISTRRPRHDSQREDWRAGFFVFFCVGSGDPVPTECNLPPLTGGKARAKLPYVTSGILLLLPSLPE